MRKHIGDEDYIKRIDLLTKQDIDNIKRSCKFDSTSIDLWVAECEKLEKNQNPVLLYKKQNNPLENFVDDDFCLIVMNDLKKK